MKRRFSCLTLRCDRNVIASYVTVDSEQTIRLGESRAGKEITLYDNVVQVEAVFSH